MSGTVEQVRSSSRGKVIAAVGLIVFVLAIILSFFFCQFRIQYRTEFILNRQKDIQQAWLDKTLDAIRVWQSELVSQARLVSSSEMFRLFMTDAANLSAEDLERLAAPDSLHSPQEELRTLAEQHAYIQDLLKDLTQKRAWTETRIVNASGQDIVAEEFASPLDSNQKELIQDAIKAGRALFGPIRQSSHGLVLDIADPLFEVMGLNEPACIGAIILTIPVERIISAFLTAPGDQNNRIMTRIVDKKPGNGNVLFMRGNYLQMEALPKPLSVSSLPFEERANLGGSGQVYSLGASPPNTDWLLIVETPANQVEALITSEKYTIYGMGIAFSAAVALLFAFGWGMATSRAHKRRAQMLESLNQTINQQKLLLDSVNMSLKAGILLLDANGYIRVCNPAFCKICGVQPNETQGKPLAEIMRGKSCTELIQAMSEMNDTGAESKWLELTIPNAQNEKRLYRVHLVPYAALPGEKITNGKGCVAIFEDITAFRAKSVQRQKREKALLATFDSAMASADPDLVGQTFKIDSLAVLLADKLNLDENQKETLRIGAMLSQIGKLFIPKDLLHKQGKFTEEEALKVKEGRENADSALDNYDFGLPVQQTVREMNERVDGRGPHGLTGEQISLCGRVLAVANAFIALTSPRSWRNDDGKSIEEALDILRKDGGFDDKIIEALANTDQSVLYRCTKYSADEVKAQPSKD